MRLYPLWANTPAISPSAMSSAIATMSVRGVITSRTGRWVKFMTPPAVSSSSVEPRPTAAPSRQMDRRSCGRVTRRAGSTTRSTAAHRRSTWTRRLAPTSGSDWVTQRGTR